MVWAGTPGGGCQKFGQFGLPKLLCNRPIVVAGLLRASSADLCVDHRSFLQIVLMVGFGRGVTRQQWLSFFIERGNSGDGGEDTVQRIIVNGRHRFVLVVMTSCAGDSDPHQPAGGDVNPVANCVRPIALNMRTGR